MNSPPKTDPRDLLLQEFIEEVLISEEGGQNSLYNTFIQPFVDVGVTAAYGVEKLSAQVQTVLAGVLYGLPTLIVPYLEYDYETFRQEEKEKVDDITKKYETTLKANLDAITSNDAFGLAFLLAPATVLAGQLAVKTPEVAFRVLDVLTGASGFLSGITAAFANAPRVGFHDPGGHDSGAWAGQGGGENMGYGDGMNEAVRQPAHSKEEILKLLKDKKTINAIQKSPIATQMRRDGVAVIVSHVQKFMALQDYDQLRARAKGDVGFSQVGQKLGQLNATGEIPKQDNPVVTNAMVPVIKKAYKDFWIKQMQQLVSKYPESRTELLDGIKQVSSLK